ncbi:SRPBCC family protein [Pseudonocardia adelaidensis]|uniref:SRPBCC family protein n=1 Tax=Pseudonocardia adelaidensis TaxID=648754 RepID=A0ABP9NTD1_9PSEU
MMPRVEVSTLIRRPPAEVFAAFVDPAITTRFWFTKSSGPLAPGATVRWEWEMYGVADTVWVEDLEESERIVLKMGADGATTAEFRFVRRAEGTVVTVVESGCSGTADEAIAHVAGSTGGYTTVLCAAKALLEHGIELGAVRDKFPDNWVQGAR